MHRLWNRYCQPLVDALAPRRILELGAGEGENTHNLIGHCRRTGAALDIVEPEPTAPLHALLASVEDCGHALHVGLGVDHIPTLQSPDLAILTSDPNWRTAFIELSLLGILAEAQGKAMPVVLAHACGWPYARRDMYRYPLELREDRRWPFAYKGMRPGSAELVDDGVNEHCANALVEGGPQNGVLTAVEDFISVNTGIRLWTLPVFGGVGILVPEARLDERLLLALEGTFAGEALMRVCMALELTNNRARAEMRLTSRMLEQCTDELAKAGALLEQRRARWEDLKGRRGSPSSGAATPS